MFDKKHQRTLSSQQMPFHHHRVRTYNQNIVYCIIEIRNSAREFGTHVEDSFFDGMYQNLTF